MITYEQAKTLTEGQVVYTIKENKIKEAKLTCVTGFEAKRSLPYAKASYRLCYKLKGGTHEYTDWAVDVYPAITLYLTKEDVAEALISDLSIRMQELEDQMISCGQKINEAKKFGGLN